MKITLNGSLFFLCLLISVTPTLAQEPIEAVPRFEPSACAFDVSAGQNIECGWLIVPENHFGSDGKTIRLAVAILKSPSSSALPDPIIFLSGGPGGAAVASGPVMATGFAPLLTKRDVVVIDQRGTGLSQPNLECPTFTEIFVTSTGMDKAQAFELGTQTLSQCRNHLTEAGIDLNTYTSAQNAADIAALRIALGYAQVNLIGGSYGTRLALTVMRDHPEGIRSVILDSTYTPESNIYLETPGNFERAFTAMVDSCTADLMCRILYPDLRGVYFELFDKLNTLPVNLVVDTPSQKVEIQVSGHLLAELVRIALYSREGVEYLPALLYNARNGDYELLKPVILLVMQISSSISHGMFFSVQCSEEAPFTTEEEVMRAASNSPPPFRSEMSVFGAFGFHMCQMWGLGTPEPIEDETVTSDIPTLIVAGGFDPVTPPSNGESAAKSITQSYFFRFPGVGHGVTSDFCPGNMLLEFLDDPIHQPDSSCITAMRAPQFFVTTAATRPIVNISLILLSGIALWALAIASVTFVRQPRQVTWRVTFREVGWIPFLISGLALIWFISQGSTDSPFAWQDKARVIESIIPLVMCVQAALMFSPDDEPALEVLLACQRRISWLMLERLGFILSIQAGIALVGVALSLKLNPEQDVLLAIVRWIPPAVFLSGIAVYTTIRSRVAAFGLTVAGLIWFGMILFGAALLPGQPTFWPLNYLQPFLWPANPYLQPGQLTMNDYWLNRAFVTAAGISLIMLAVYQLRDEEQVLLGSRKGKRK